MKYKKLSEHEADRLRKWWKSLDDSPGVRARLRRAASPEEALLSPAFSHCLRALPAAWHEEGRTARGVPLSVLDIASVAAVLARVKRDVQTDNGFAKCLASPSENGGRARMSALRFQQLQKSRTPEEFFTRLCRALQLVKNEANIALLADDMLHWFVEYRFGPAQKPQDSLAIRWAMDYYSTLND